MKQIINTINKIIKIFLALYLATLTVGFIFPTYIRDNAINLFNAISTAEIIPIGAWITGLFLIGLILWFGTKTLWKLISTRGNLRKFWNEI